MALEFKTTHLAEALLNIPEQFKGKANFAALLTVFMSAIQDLENAAEDVYELRFIDSATSAQLDVLGAIVGEARAGLSDADYLIRVRVKVLINLSSGTADEILTILRFSSFNANSFLYIEEAPAAFTIKTTNALASFASLAAILHDTKSAGVRALLEYYLCAAGDVFSFDGTAGDYTGFLDGADGGQFATAIEGV